MQDDAAFKQKQREDKKKMAEAQARAGQKGPMGECLGQRVILTLLELVLAVFS